MDPIVVVVAESKDRLAVMVGAAMIVVKDMLCCLNIVVDKQNIEADKQGSTDRIAVAKKDIAVTGSNFEGEVVSDIVVAAVAYNLDIGLQEAVERRIGGQTLSVSSLIFSKGE